MNKQSVIILHGWGLSGGRFNELKEEFASKGYRVFTPDLPGFGKSEAPRKAFYLADYAEFLYDFMKNNDIKNPILVGHSFGGRVSLKFQMMFPRSVRALILTGTPGFTPTPRKRLMVFIALAKIGKAISSVWPLNLLQERIRTWYYYAVGAREFTKAEGVMRDVFKHVVAEDLAPYMKTVNAPCLLVWGQDDRITPLWIAERMKERISGAKLIVIPESDHGVSYKQSKRFMVVIEGFLKSL